MYYKVTNPLMVTELEAMNLLNRMRRRITENGYVTVEEMYDMVLMLNCYRGAKDYAYGWKTLHVANVKFNSDEGAYEVRLPIPVAL